MSASIVEVKTPKIADSTNLYKLNIDTFQPPKSIIPLDILHRVDHKTSQYLSIPVLNAKYVLWNISKNTLITSMWGSAMRSRRSVGADSDVIPLNYFPRYHRTPAYNWNQILIFS